MLPSAKVAMLLERSMLGGESIPSTLAQRTKYMRPKEEPERPMKLTHCLYIGPDGRVCREKAGSEGWCKKHEEYAREAICDLQDGVNQSEATAILHELHEGQNRSTEMQQAQMEALGYGREFYPMPDEGERLERYMRKRRQR